MGSHKTEVPKESRDLLHVITRRGWQARERKLDKKLDHVPKLPYKMVLDHFTFTDPCKTTEECVRAVQIMQEKDMSKGYNDIKFNFLIGGDGQIYEGRGWRVCATRTLKSVIQIWRRRLDIAFIGDYTETPIPDDMMRRFQEIVEFGVKEVLIKRTPISYHMRKGLEVLPVEGTMDDYVGNVLLAIKKREEENDEVLRDKKQREKAMKERKEAEDIEEGRVKTRETKKEIPYSDCPCESHHKKAQEDKIYRKVESQIKEVLRKTTEKYGI